MYIFYTAAAFARPDNGTIIEGANGLMLLWVLRGEVSNLFEFMRQIFQTDSALRGV